MRRRRGARKRRIVAQRLLMLWIAVVTLYFLWEADHYSGLYAFLAEWQYEQLGHHFPILTFGLLLILFGAPALILLAIGRRARRDGLGGAAGEGQAVTAEAGSADAPVNAEDRRAIAVGTNFRRALFAVAGGFAIAAVVVLLWTLFLPRVAPPEHSIAVGSPGAAKPPLGPAELTGEIVYTRTSAFAQKLLFSARGVRFAPVVKPGTADRTLTYFVELPPTERGIQRAVPLVSHRKGVLLRNSLPGSIVRLYRYAGYDIDKPYYVLYTSSMTIRWPYYVTAMQLVLAALIVFVAGLAQHVHVRRVDRAQAGAEEPNVVS